MYENYIRAASQEHNVPEAWIRAVIQTESSWRPEAYRAEPQISDASYGLMQLLGRTARSLGFDGDPKLLYNPEINIDLGTKLLGQLRARYGDDFRRIYSAYNSGKPDLWETSAQVATNVQRALTALEKYIREDVGAMMQVPLTAAAENPNLVAVGIVAFVILWLWSGSGRKR